MCQVIASIAAKHTITHNHSVTDDVLVLGTTTVTVLALLTWVLLAYLNCSKWFLKFCVGKMTECMDLEAGVHNSVREGTPAASLAKAKMRLSKSLCHLEDSRSQCLPTFANASGFRGT